MVQIKSLISASILCMCMVDALNQMLANVNALYKCDDDDDDD